MSWIINIPVDLKKFFARHGEIEHYLAVKKQVHMLSPGDIAVLWGGRHTRHSGILGYGVIMTYALKPSSIPREYRKLYDENSLQVGFKPIHLSYMDAFIPERHAYLLPSLNQYKQPVRIGKKSIYWGFGIYDELQFFLDEYRYLFKNFLVAYNDSDFQFAIHILRERYFRNLEFNKYRRKLSNLPLICNSCKVNYEKLFGKKIAVRILELHEQIAPSDKYIKIQEKNFAALCPTCHKIEHEKIRNTELI